MSNDAQNTEQGILRRRTRRTALALGGVAALGIAVGGGFYLRDELPVLPDLAPDPSTFVITATDGEGMDNLTSYDADGISWSDAPRPPKVHMHFRQTLAFSGMSVISRCPCGGMRYNGQSEDRLPWVQNMSKAQRRQLIDRNSLDPENSPANDQTRAAADYLRTQKLDIDGLYLRQRDYARELHEAAVRAGVQVPLNAVHAAAVLIGAQQEKQLQG